MEPGSINCILKPCVILCYECSINTLRPKGSMVPWVLEVDSHTEDLSYEDLSYEDIRTINSQLI